MKITKLNGATLIEFILALTIGWMIIAVLIKSYIDWHEQWRLQQAKNQLQENMRFISNLLLHEIHLAGFIGCARLTYDFPLKNNTHLSFTIANRLFGNERNHFDALTVMHASENGTTLAKPMRGRKTLYLASRIPLSESKENILMIADCKHTDVFSAANFSQDNKKITARDVLAFSYNEQAEISLLSKRQFYLDKTGRVRRDGSEISAIYMDDLQLGKTELVEGVDQMKIKYRLHGSDEELIAAEVYDWSQVIAVSIELTFNSIEIFKKKPIQQKLHLYAALLN